jgi:hypothetical protein
MSQYTPEPEMTEFEQSLAALSPSRGRLDRDRLMFEAGRRSAIAPRRATWAWPAVAASLAAVVLGQTFALTRRPEPRIVERVVVVYEPADVSAQPVAPVVVLSRNPAPEADRPDESAESPYLRLRRQIERFGLDGLPEPSPLLTLSGGRESPTGFAPNAPDVLRRFQLDQVLDRGGPL